MGTLSALLLVSKDWIRATLREPSNIRHCIAPCTIPWILTRWLLLLFLADSNGIRWKSAATGNEDSDVSTSRTIPAKVMKGALWNVFGRSGHLRLQTSSTNNKALPHELRFDGFPPTDLEKLKSTLQQLYKLELQKHNMTAAGVSWGLTEVEDRNLIFRQCVLEDANEEGEEFEPRAKEEFLSLDLAEVSQCVLPGNNRNEIELQFPESDAVEAGTDQLGKYNQRET